RFVVFASSATNLVPGITDTNNQQDIFVRDLQMGITQLVSANPAGTATGNNNSRSPSISADGRFVCFVSAASDLVPGDTNGFEDVFVRDLQTRTTTLVSIGTAGTSGNGQSHDPAMSAAGRVVAFVSEATDLLAGVIDVNGIADVFVRDLKTAATHLATIDRTGSFAAGGQAPLAISDDGRFVAFMSAGNGLAAIDTGGG